MPENRMRRVMSHISRLLKDKGRLETGFSMLEAVVVVGVLLALAVSGFLSYGPIVENAKFAKVKSAASDVYTAAMSANFDGNPDTDPQEVVDTYNGSNDTIKTELLDPTPAGTTSTYKPTPDKDFCVAAHNVQNPKIKAKVGACPIDEGATPPNGTPTEPTPTPPPVVTTPPVVTNPPPVVPVTPAVSKGIMTTVWDTSLAPNCEQITVPIAGFTPNKLQVEWGNNTPKTKFVTDSPVYGNIGRVTITTYGDFSDWQFEENGETDANCLVEVTKWRDTQTTNATAAFMNANNLTLVSEIPSTVTNAARMFAFSEANPDISGIRTDNVTDMSQMFEEAHNFNQSLANFNTSKATKMSLMFSAAYNFNQSLANFNTSNVTDMHEMFLQAYNFNQPLANFDTSSVTNMSSMFSQAYNFNQPLASFNTSKVTNMSWMFATASNFNQSLSSFNTSNVTDMSNMFYYAAKFNQSLAGFDTSNVNSMRAMFQNANVFNQPLTNFDTSKVTDMSSMFNNAKVFNKSLASFNTSNVTAMSEMFNSAYEFNQPLAFDTSKVTDMYAMFFSASKFNQNLSNWNVSRVPRYAHDYFSDSADAWKLPKPSFP